MRNWTSPAKQGIVGNSDHDFHAVDQHRLYEHAFHNVELVGLGESHFHRVNHLAGRLLIRERGRRGVEAIPEPLRELDALGGAQMGEVEERLGHRRNLASRDRLRQAMRVDE